MREIKFRVWDKEKSCFQMCINDSLRFGCDSIVTIPRNSNKYVIQQFTGLLDKNNKEIYEGDLVDFVVPGVAHGREKEEYKSQVVYYNQELASFMFGKNYTKTGDYWGHCMLDEIEKRTLEVVGNVFEKK